MKRFLLIILASYLIFLLLGIWSTAQGGGTVMTIEMRQTSQYADFSDSCIEILQKIDIAEEAAVRKAITGKDAESSLVTLSKEHLELLQSLATEVEKRNPPKHLSVVHSQMLDTVKTRIELSQSTGQAFAEDDPEKYKQRDKLRRAYNRKLEATITAQAKLSRG